jgi:hypothetical protein
VTEDELAAIRERAERATPGPWEAKIFDITAYDSELGRKVNLFEAYTDNHEDNCQFVAHAREDMPALLAELDRLRAEVERLKSQRVADGELASVRKAQAEAKVAAMRPIVEAVAKGTPMFPFSGISFEHVDVDVEWLMPQARALLAKGAQEWPNH